MTARLRIDPRAYQAAWELRHLWLRLEAAQATISEAFLGLLANDVTGEEGMIVVEDVALETEEVLEVFGDDAGSRHMNAPPAALPLATISAAAFADTPAPPRKWIVPDMVPDRNVTDLGGDGGVGKSQLALQLAAAMTSGTDWLGTMPEPGRVIYISCEDELAEVHRRIGAIAADKHLTRDDLADLHVLDLTSAPTTELGTVEKGTFHLTEMYQRLAATARSLSPKLIVLDTRTDAFGGSEIDRGQVRNFVRSLRRLCLEDDLAILMLSHPSLTGMSSGTGQSGSTAWGNSVRSRLYLERPKADDGSEPDPDLRVLSMRKSNFGRGDVTIRVRWQSGVYHVDGTGAGVLDRMAAENAADDRFMELLREFERQGRHVNARSGPYYAPKEFAAADANIGKRQFKAAMQRLFTAERIKIAPYGPPSRGMTAIVEVMP